MAGAPNFQSLDGAMLGITAAMREERGKVDLDIDVIFFLSAVDHGPH
jgi:hypothetical protein